MSRAIFLKTLRDRLLLTILMALAIVALEMAIVRAIVEMCKDLELLRTWLSRPLMQSLIRLALGADLAGDLTPTTMSTFGLGHPLLYALAWALMLTIGTGVIAGEIDRGTADLLLTLPVARRAVYVSTSLVWVLAAALVSAAPLPGLWIGQRLCPLPEPLEFQRLWPVSVNFLALNLAVASVAMLISSFSSRRGPAVGIVLAGILASDLINLLSQFWEAIKPISFLGFLHYYRLLPVVRSGQLPYGDIATLMALALGAWLVGLWHFSRRDIRAA